MRAPRHRFSDDVRSTTRSIAAAMVEEGAIARSPDELEAWLTDRPRVRASLEAEGYHTAFDAADLFPLLRAMIDQQGESVPTEPAATRSPRPALLAAGALIVAVALGVIIGLLA